jgi:tRNA (mo5U34)-methyltransferase
MRNVWLLPTIAELSTWLRRCGFKDIEVIDRSITTTDEQRSTEWMPFESLAEALAPDDPTQTVEGWPAPHRAIVTAIAP